MKTNFIYNFKKMVILKNTKNLFKSTILTSAMLFSLQSNAQLSELQLVSESSGQRSASTLTTLHNCMVIEANLGFIEGVGKTLFADQMNKISNLSLDQMNNKAIELASRMKTKINFFSTRNAFKPLVNVISQVKHESEYYKIEDCQKKLNSIANLRMTIFQPGTQNTLNVVQCQKGIRTAFFYNGVNQTIEALADVNNSISIQKAKAGGDVKAKLEALHASIAQEIEKIKSLPEYKKIIEKPTLANDLVNSNHCFLKSEKAK